jgi:small subunit ribosomal protein S17
VANENTSAAPQKADEAGREKSRKRRLIGVVTSDKMDKTRVVQVERRLAHAKYGKYMTKRTKYKAHDEKNEFRVGDKVVIVESRPLSREKRWKVEKLIERPQEA